MKRILTIVVLCITTFAMATNEVKKVRRSRRRPPHHSAGILERREAIPSRQIDVFNAQSFIETNIVDEAVKKARFRSSLPLKYGDTKSPVKIEIIESDTLDSLTISPDDFKAQINIKTLSADGATKDVVAERLQTQLARTAYFLLGSGMVTYQCLTQPVSSLKELDRLNKVQPGAEAMMHLHAGKRVGVRMINYATYQQACREGWAPAPTNDVQKAIWDKVHAMPTAPMKIKPETKKVRE